MLTKFFNRYGYVVFAWFTTLLLALVILWLATIRNFDVNTDVTNEVVKVFFRMFLYGLLLLLVFRSFIATFRSTVQRLSQWRSKGEAAEDAEFALIIETLIVMVSVLGVILFACFEEFLQGRIEGRSSEVKDVLVSVMATLLSALVVYSIPVVGELEMAIKHYYVRRRKQLQAKRKQ